MNNIKNLKLSLIVLFLLSCSPQLFNLASEYQGNVICLDSLQKNLRLLYSDCDYDVDCFKDESDDYIEDIICTDYKLCGFISVKECKKSSFQVVDAMVSSFSRKEENVQTQESVQPTEKEPEQDDKHLKVIRCEKYKTDLYRAEDNYTEVKAAGDKVGATLTETEAALTEARAAVRKPMSSEDRAKANVALAKAEDAFAKANSAASKHISTYKKAKTRYDTAKAVWNNHCQQY